MVDEVMSAHPSISVVVPTRNRARYLPLLISSITSQSERSWELILVDDCSDDDTPCLVSSQSDTRIRYVRLDSHQGMTKSRNAGIKRARAEVILSCEDDVWLEQNCLAEVLSVFNMGADVACFSRVELRGAYRDPLSYVRTLQVHHGGWRTPFVYLTPFGEVVQTAGPRRPVEVEACTGVFAARTRALQSVGAYDEHYAGNAYHEEIDLQRRLRRRGYRIVFTPNTFYVHFRFRGKGGGDSRGLIRYDISAFKNHLRFVRRFWPARFALPLMILFLVYYFTISRGLQLLRPHLSISEADRSAKL